MRSISPLRSVLFAAMLTLPLGARQARATPNFPAAIEAHLSLSAPPACTICHATSAGGEGTVTKPFGIAMEQAGLRAFDVASLDAALDALKAAHTSSAGDLVPDITKLEEGLDPNVPVNGSFGPDEPSFGCGARIAPGGPLPDDHGACMIGLIGLAVARKRSRRRKPGAVRDD